MGINSKTRYAHAMEYFSLTNKRTISPKTVKIYVKWKPSNMKFKLNIDGPVDGNMGKRGIGEVIRNKDGNWIVGFMGNLFSTTNVMTELKALVKSLKIVITHN